VDAPAELPRAPGGRVAHANRNPFLQGAGDTFDGAEADLQSEPGPPPAPSITELAAGTAARVTGASGDRVRLTTSDGETGYVELGALATADSVGTERTLTEAHLLRDPRVGDAFGRLEAGARVTLIGQTKRGRLVLLPSGRAAVLETLTDI
jgi:hypothetical protein